jgi:AraC family transcriptional regulator
VTSVQWWIPPPNVQVQATATGFTTALWGWENGIYESVGEASPDTATIAFSVSTLDTEFAVDGRRYFAGAFRPGMLAVVPAGCQPSVVQRGGGRKLHLYLPDTLLVDAAGHELHSDRHSRINLRPRAGHDDGAAAICRRVLDSFSDRRRGSQLLHDALGIELAVHAVRSWVDSSPKAAPGVRPLPRNALRRVVDYLHSDIAANPSLATLAGLVGLSPAHFCRTFSAATGMAPHRYLIRLRIEAAAQQLAYSADPVAAIALRVGYDDPGYFARIFKRHKGLTPLQYRSERQS